MSGIVTDREIVIRALAGDRGPDELHVERSPRRIWRRFLWPDEPADGAVRTIRAKGTRRVPVIPAAGAREGN